MKAQALRVHSGCAIFLLEKCAKAPPSAVYLSLYSSTVEHNTVNIMIDVRFILGAFNMCIKLKDL